MRNCTFNYEARACRRGAVRFAGGPQPDLLLRMELFFEKLPPADLVYIERREGSRPHGRHPQVVQL